MIVEKAVIAKLVAAFDPVHMSLVNESHMHSVPENSETHFKLVLVSEHFEGKRAVQRHQSIYSTLADYMNNPIHALTMHLFTAEEWALVPDGEVRQSPPCLGGSKADAL